MKNYVKVFLAIIMVLAMLLSVGCASKDMGSGAPMGGGGYIGAPDAAPEYGGDSGGTEDDKGSENGGMQIQPGMP